MIQKWQKPPHGVVKLNFNGSVKKDDNIGGIGVLARNDKVEVLGAVQAIIEGVTDSATVEAYAGSML